MHPLIRLADRIDWEQVDERVGLCYAEENTRSTQDTDTQANQEPMSLYI